MLVANYHQVVAEYGEGIHLHIVVAVFLALVFDVELLLGALVRAEEAGPCGDGTFVYLGGGRCYAAGIDKLFLLGS